MKTQTILYTILAILFIFVILNNLHKPTAAQPSTQIETCDLDHPTQEAIDYFNEIAYHSEYGERNFTIKWEGPLRIKIHTNLTAEDSTTINQVILELRNLTNLDIKIVDDNSNIDMYFTNQKYFYSYDVYYEQKKDLGFFSNWYDDNNIIYRARILIDNTNRINQQERNHLIREELTQSLGLEQDSIKYLDSIFQQRWTSTQDYSCIDKQIIKMLYK